MAGPREVRPPTPSDDHHRRRESYPPAGTDTLIAIGEAEQRLEALAAALTEALIAGDPPLVSAALAAIRLADVALLHLKAARLAVARVTAKRRVPPYSEPAERSLLGAMLLSAAALEAARQAGIEAESFYRPNHGHIFEAISAVAGDAGTVDQVTVADRLARNGIELSIADLASMAIDAPSSGHAASYADIVVGHHRARQLISIAGEIAEAGYTGADTDAVVEVAQEWLTRLGNGRRSSLAIRAFADIEQETVEWVWQDRIPRGMVTIVAGDPGVGKSFVMVALAAGLSVGAQLPGGTGPSAAVSSLIVNYEDAAGVTLKKRIAACGADQRLVHNLDGVVDGVGIRPFRPEDARYLEAELIRRPEVAMVVIDPVGSLLAGKLDMARDNEVRGALLPLADMARRTNVAVVAVMHLRKEDAARVIYRVGGSVGGFVGLARSVLLVGKEQTTGRRAVAHGKCNVGPEMSSVEYVIGSDGSFAWKGVAEDLSAEQMLAAATPEGKRQAAGVWLNEYLAEGEALAQTVIDAGRKKGFSYATLNRALEDIGGDSVQRQEPGKVGRGPAYWFLPS